VLSSEYIDSLREKQAKRRIIAPAAIFCEEKEKS
jgi:hypothetical protein